MSHTDNNTLAKAILNKAELMPEKIAIVDKNGSRKTTWKEFATLIEQIADYALSIELKGVIPVVQDRGMEYAASVLGLQLAGLAISPLTKDTPAKRIEYIKSDLGTEIVADAAFVEIAQKEGRVRKSASIANRRINSAIAESACNKADFSVKLEQLNQQSNLSANSEQSQSPAIGVSCQTSEAPCQLRQADETPLQSSQTSHSTNGVSCQSSPVSETPCQSSQTSETRSQISPASEAPCQLRPASEAPLQSSQTSHSTNGASCQSSQTDETRYQISEAPCQLRPTSEAPLQSSQTSHSTNGVSCQSSQTDETRYQISPVDEAPCQLRPTSEAPCQLRPASEAPLQSIQSHSDIAWVIYTSGSTGHPKGVVYSNANLLSACLVMAEVNRMSENTVSAASSPFSFCASLVDLYAPLCCGASVHILSDECRKDNYLLEQYLIANSITYTFISPRMLANITCELPDMELIITAGEKVAKISPRSYQINVAYGMTESIALASFFFIDKYREIAPIGKAAEGKNIYLLNEYGELSDEGEICISGVIAEGYWNLPEQTAKVFTTNPFSDDPRHKKLLHTGDIARRLDDGNLLFLNREDWMLKINGQRVEPEEIENQIKAIKGVCEAVVKGFESSNTYLCAWYTGDVTENELKSQLADRLNSYMMPAFIIKLDAFPINANGKLDRKALTAPDASDFLTTYEAPIDEVEAAICNAFQQILGLERIGRNDDFFSLGGDSISAIKLCSLLKTHHLKSSHIFIGRSPKGIAEICSTQISDPHCAIDSGVLPIDSQNAICPNDSNSSSSQSESHSAIQSTTESADRIQTAAEASAQNLTPEATARNLTPESSTRSLKPESSAQSSTTTESADRIQTTPEASNQSLTSEYSTRSLKPESSAQSSTTTESADRIQTTPEASAQSCTTPEASAQNRTPEATARILKPEFSNQDHDNYPLSIGQLGVYYACIDAAVNFAYNLPFAIKLAPQTDIDKLHKAIEKVLNTYPVFGVRFQVIDGQPRMVKREPYIEIEHLKAKEEEIKEIKSNFIRPFDLEKAELSRFMIVKTELAIHLLIDIHHIIFDGSSLKVLIDALDKAYKGENLPKEYISIFQAADIEQKADNTSAYEFFKEHLTANEFESTLASDLPQDSQNETGEIFEYHFEEISNKIEYFARKCSISEASVFMGAFAWAFSKMIGSQNIGFCIAENGRPDSEYASTIAMLVRTLPLAISIDEAIEPSTYLSNLSQYFYQTIANDTYPFYKLAEEFEVNNDTMFVYQADMLDTLSFNDSSIQIEQLDTKYALSKLSVSVYKTKGSYKASISYRSDLYSINKIQTLCSLMQAALSGFVDGLALKDIPLCSDSDIQLLETFHGKDTDASETAIAGNFRHCVSSGEANSAQSECGDDINQLSRAAAEENAEVASPSEKISSGSLSFTSNGRDSESSGEANSAQSECGDDINQLSRAAAEENAEVASPSEKISSGSLSFTSNGRDSVGDILRRSMKLYPNNIAVVSGETKITYKELDEITDRLAAYIIKQGIGREDVVAILADRNEMMAICPIAVIKAGAMYQPLDSSYPKDRLNYMIKDSGAKLLITPEHLRQLIETEIEIFYSEDIQTLPASEAILPEVKPEDAFVIIYTSGSTGLPKGCVLEHRNLISYFKHFIKNFDFNSQSKVSAYASFGFDASMMDLYPALCVGGSVCIIPEDIRLDLEALNRYFEANGITHAFFTTQVGRQFALTIRNKSLKYLMTGGESLVNISPNDNYKLANMYGPTETTLVVCHYPIDKFYKLPPIGRAFDNVNFYVLDPYMRRVPVGMSGELYIAGPQVSRGYLNLPEKTAQCFLDNPFSDNPKYKRMYRSGDIVSFLPDGNVQFVGRKDNQVKIRGFRIELSEIEEVIRRYEGIKNVALVTFNSQDSGKYIAAYIVSDEEVDIDKLNAFIRSEKPAYMVPAVTMQIDEIPLTPNCKINRKALPTPVRKAENIQKAQTATQQMIFDLIAELLGHKEFGINTDLEYAGLTSINSIKLLSILSKAFDRPLSIKELKDNNTIEKLETILSEHKENEEFELREEYPLTKTQEGIFYECMNKPDSTFYNVPYIIELAESIDLEKLKGAIVKTVNAHPYLMTTLSLTEEGVRCRRDINARFQLEDIEEIRVDCTEGLSSTLCKAFELQGGKLFRIALIYSEEKTLLYLDVHHIIFDGSSFAVLLEDINRAYSGENLETEKFSGYEAALNEQLLRSTDNWEKAKNYYNELFADHSDISLPYGDCPNDSGYASYNYTLQNTSQKDIDAFCSGSKLTRNTVFTAAFGYLLAKYIADDCAVFTTVYDGRNDTRFAKSISMFVKTYPVFCDISQDNVSDYLNGLSKQIEASRLNDIYSFAEMHSDLGINADLMFVYQDSILEYDTFCGEKFIGQEVQIDTEKAPFTINIWLKDSKFYLSAEYDASKYSKEYIESFATAFELALKGIITKSHLNDIELVDDKTLAVLESFHGEEVAYENCSVTDSVRRAMKLYPDKIAIVSGETKITYKELDDITDRLAAYIASKGIGREDAVAILADRDEYMAICPIAAIKAAAMYVPLDSSYPKDRLNYMIEDSGAKLLITPKSLRQVVDTEIDVFYTEDIASLPESEISLPAPSHGNAFVILYTSGSTGKPKGSVLEHSNFVAYSKFYQDRFNYDESSVVALYASFGFDANMMDTFTPLSVGATIHIIPIDMRLNLPLLNKYLEDNKITHIFMTTQIGRTFATTQDNHSLKYLIVAGEALTPVEAGKNYIIVNGYGPSETCCGVSFFDIDRLYKSVPLGKPNYNTKAYIVDKQFRRVPIGVPGELCIAGPQVSRGYINLPEKTAESFVANPFCDDSKYNRIYRTGDIICFLPDGNLQFFGRKDSQVKIRGFRIELTEVEEVISRFEAVKDAVVVAFDNPDGGKFLAAYIVADEKLDIERLNAFIRAEKPAYMVPAATMQIDKIPLTPNQKVNIKALPKPEINSSRNYIAPQNTIEEDFCEIMGQTLNIKQYSAVDSFFELGGSSISATKVLIGAMAKGYKIVYPDLFRYPSPRELALFINSSKVEKSDDDIAAYDYSEINKFLSDTNIDKVDEAIARDFSILNNKMGNVLLTGVTGFLGIHILYVFLKGYSGDITCLIRKKEKIANEDWIKALLMFYFSNDCSDVFDHNRIHFVEADINDENLSEKLQDADYDTIIHCAASVSHFASDDILSRVNTQGTINMLKICEEKKKRFVHISTVSVSGFKSESQTKDIFTENDVYISQLINNEYIRTKYLAERYLLEAAMRGVDVKILRVGNLTSRYHDGEFQINFATNGFMRNIRGVLTLGYSSIDLENKEVNISPIDCTAEAVLAIADSDLPVHIYHVYNDKINKLSELTASFQDCGFPMKLVSETEYRRQIALATQKYKDDATMSDIIAGLVAYKDPETGTELESVQTSNLFTTEVLFRLGFTWPKIEKWYIRQMIQIMIDMGFFEK